VNCILGFLSIFDFRFRALLLAWRRYLWYVMVDFVVERDLIQISAKNVGQLALPNLIYSQTFFYTFK